MSLSLYCSGVLAAGVEVLAEFLVGRVAVQDAVADQLHGMRDGDGCLVLGPCAAIAAEAADQAVELNTGPGPGPRCCLGALGQLAGQVRLPWRVPAGWRRPADSLLAGASLRAGPGVDAASSVAGSAG